MYAVGETMNGDLSLSDMTAEHRATSTQPLAANDRSLRGMSATARRGNAHGWDPKVVDGGGVRHSDAQAVHRAELSEMRTLGSSFQPSKLPEALVPRGRLLDLVSDGVRERAVTLICAPAGAGKTVLASAWCADNVIAWPTAWLTTGVHTDSPASFWCHVVGAITRAGVSVTHADRSLRQPGPDIAFHMELAADLLDSTQPVVLVIDDFDCIVNSAVLDGIDLLARQAYPNLRLVLCARGVPRLPVHRYRLTDSLAEIPPHMLAFTANEAQQLFANHGLALSPEMVEQVRWRTAGWAAGLRLAAISLNNLACAAASGTVNADALAAALVRSDALVAEYMRTEVLYRLPDELRAVVLRLGVSEELCPRLVEQLAGVSNGRQILADLHRAGAFLEPLDDITDGYRLHRSFRDALEGQPHQEAPGEHAQLHAVCAQWCATHGRPVAAVRHAASAHDWKQAAALIIDDLGVTALIDPLDIDHLGYVEALASMPSDVDGASAAVVQAALAIGRRDPHLAAQRLRHADDLIDSAAAPLELELSAVIVRLAVCAETGGHIVDGLREAESAHALLDRLPADHRAAQPKLTALVATLHGIALMWSGADDSAIAAFDNALKVLAARIDEPVGSGYSQLRSLNLSAILHATQGRLRTAKLLGEAAHRLADRLGQPESRASSALGLQWLGRTPRSATMRPHRDGCVARRPASTKTTSGCSHRCSQSFGADFCGPGDTCPRLSAWSVA
jgi:LuxR family maltose regulon positive regulatory protein